MSGSKCEKRRECGEMESVKKEGDSVKKGKCDNKGEQKPYIQFLSTAYLYSFFRTLTFSKRVEREVIYLFHS